MLAVVGLLQMALPLIGFALAMAIPAWASGTGAVCALPGSRV